VRRSMAWAHPVADHSGSREEAEQKGRQASRAERAKERQEGAEGRANPRGNGAGGLDGERSALCIFAQRHSGIQDEDRKQCE